MSRDLDLSEKKIRRIYLKNLKNLQWKTNSFVKIWKVVLKGYISLLYERYRMHNNLRSNKYACKSVQIIQHYKKCLLLNLIKRNVKFIIKNIKRAIKIIKTNIILTNKREKNQNVIIASIVILQINLTVIKKIKLKIKLKINYSIASFSLLLYIWKCNLQQLFQHWELYIRST